MKRFYLGALYMLLGFTSQSFSQEINQGPRVTALGNTGVALQDVWSLQSNQAGLTALKKPIASLSYRNSYLSPEINTQSAVFAYPFGRNVLGISLQKYGFSAYSEQKAGLTYAKSFGEILSVSLNFNLHQIKITQYGGERTYSVEAGMQYKPYQQLTIGAHVSNPNRNAFDADVNAVLPVSLDFGASYQFTDKVLLNTGVVKSLNDVADFRCGVEYLAISALAFRGGLSVNPFRQFVGFGYQVSDLKIDAAASSHPYLGFSPQIALSYEF